MVDICIENNITPDEYCILDLLNTRQYEKIRSLFDRSLIKEDDFHSLENKGFVKLLDAFTDTIRFELIGIREKTNLLFKNDDKYNDYLKIWSMFPIKVPNEKGSYRVLKSGSEDFKKGLKLWKEIVKKESPSVIQKGLENQLKITRNSLQYTQNWLTWLRQKTWQKYVYIELADNGTGTTEKV